MTDLDVVDIAWLSDGPRRVVEAALVALVQTGRVRVRPSGLFGTVRPARRSAVDAAVLDAVGTGGHRSIDTVLWRVAGDARLLEVGRRLRAAGLVSRVTGRPTRAGRRRTRVLLAGPPGVLAPDGSDAWEVALRGPGALHAGDLRAALLAPPRTVGSRLRRSRSTDPQEAAAEAWLEARRTATVLHGGRGQWFAPGS